MGHARARHGRADAPAHAVSLLTRRPRLVRSAAGANRPRAARRVPRRLRAARRGAEGAATQEARLGGALRLPARRRGHAEQEPEDATPGVCVGRTLGGARRRRSRRRLVGRQGHAAANRQAAEPAAARDQRPRGAVRLERQGKGGAASDQPAALGRRARRRRRDHRRAAERGGHGRNVPERGRVRERFDGGGVPAAARRGDRGGPASRRSRGRRGGGDYRQPARGARAVHPRAAQQRARLCRARGRGGPKGSDDVRADQ
mmetsp:Transcript_12738/g.40637  ORF Transcript_12738/g.40637 Transcript_12738/m.40637 type:complete len:259 (-) Transcript_12738:347-1123(-)